MQNDRLDKLVSPPFCRQVNESSKFVGDRPVQTASGTIMTSQVLGARLFVSTLVNACFTIISP